MCENRGGVVRTSQLCVQGGHQRDERCWNEGTPENIAVIILKIEQCCFTIEKCTEEQIRRVLDDN